MDTANVLHWLRTQYGINTDPVMGPLKVSDFRFIAEGVEQDWNTFDTARELAHRIATRETASLRS